MRVSGARITVSARPDTAGLSLRDRPEDGPQATARKSQRRPGTLTLLERYTQIGDDECEGDSAPPRA
jgi:hypothetical protein